MDLDDVARADVGAMTALYALGNIDHRKIVLHNDSVCGALSLALHAAYAACIADLVDRCALVVAGAADEDMLIVGNELDDLLGAGVDTVAAAYALFTIDLRNTVNDAHCTELAGLCAVAEADACEAAVHIALAAEKHGSLAILRTGIVEAFESLALNTGAGNECDHFNGIVCGDTHDLTDLCSGFRTAGNTLVDGGFALCDRSGIAVTAGIAAAAAVCTGEALTNSFLLGVYFNIEDLCGECKQGTEDAAHYAKDEDGEKNTCKVHT